ncbi:glycosyltransferase [bacterium]|nr:glycosyltransferase [bacterium]
MLTKQKKISFLITTHNGEKYIITLLNKVIHLMEFDKNIHEIIILDDDSKDETISLIENYIIDKTDFIKLVKFNNKKGIF